MYRPYRILITGAPGCGKTTLAARIAAMLGINNVRSTDVVSVDAVSWSEASAQVVHWMASPGPWVIEGCRVAHAVRKWFATGHADAPADYLFVLYDEFIEPTPRQAGLGKQVANIIDESLPQLQRSGVVIARGRAAALLAIRAI